MNPLFNSFFKYPPPHLILQKRLNPRKEQTLAWNSYMCHKIAVRIVEKRPTSHCLHPCNRSAHLSFVLSCRKVKYLNMKGSLVDEHTVRALTKAGKEVSCFYFKWCIIHVFRMWGIENEIKIYNLLLSKDDNRHNVVMHFKMQNLLEFWTIY